MTQFTTPFIGKLVGKNLWEVYEPFEYHIGKYPSNEIIKIPVGYRTDFASVPRILWCIISPVDDHAKAAVVHDYCYDTGKYSRKRCDQIFREALTVLDIPKWKIFSMYWSVRLFSYKAWLRCRKKN